jgi:hypothetical protein
VPARIVSGRPSPSKSASVGGENWIGPALRRIVPFGLTTYALAGWLVRVEDKRMTRANPGRTRDHRNPCDRSTQRTRLHHLVNLMNKRNISTQMTPRYTCARHTFGRSPIGSTTARELNVPERAQKLSPFYHRILLAPAAMASWYCPAIRSAALTQRREPEHHRSKPANESLGQTRRQYRGSWHQPFQLPSTAAKFDSR